MMDLLVGGGWLRAMTNREICRVVVEKGVFRKEVTLSLSQLTKVNYTV